ncbi:MAG: hypothetical protein ACC641_04600 [Acidiferrobacterales bacterium]
MPKIVDKLTRSEKEIEEKIRERFTEEQMCAYFLTKTIRSQYQFNDDFISGWYEEIFGRKPEDSENARRELVRAYTDILMLENKYRFHLDYWIRQLQGNLIVEMEAFFEGQPGQ